MKNRENIYNIPNALTILRIILTFVIIAMIFLNFNITQIIIVFVIGALTDLLDGQIARRFHLCTEFGRKADLIADRFLWIGTALSFIIFFSITGKLNILHYIQIVFIMSREIISAPFAIIAFYKKYNLPHAKFIAKVNTFIQGFALPALILSVFYPQWTYLSLPLSVAILVTGTLSAKIYISEYDADKPNS